MLQKTTKAQFTRWLVSHEFGNGAADRLSGTLANSEFQIGLKIMTHGITSELRLKNICQ